MTDPTPTPTSAMEEAKAIVFAWDTRLDPCETTTKALILAIARALSKRGEWQGTKSWCSCGHIAWGTCSTCYIERGKRLSELEAQLREREAELGRYMMANNALAEKLREREAAIAAKDAALQFAEGAIDDAIYTEDGLDGTTGERVLHLCREARESSTFDQEPFDRSRLPSVEVEALRTQLRERERELGDHSRCMERKDAAILHVQQRCDQAEREVERLRETLAKLQRVQRGMVHTAMCGCDATQNDLDCHIGIVTAALLPRRPGPEQEREG